MNHTSKSPSPRAWAIAEGLVRTRRATKYDAIEGYIRADGGAQRYWISDDGKRVLRGTIIPTAEELQDGFIEAMARADKVR
jgi:hypothetical protein